MVAATLVASLTFSISHGSPTWRASHRGPSKPMVDLSNLPKWPIADDVATSWSDSFIQKPGGGTPTPSATPSVTPATLAAWQKVNRCEEGGNWGWSGPAYPDGLGISAANWSEYGGAGDLSPAAQIAVGQRIEAAAGRPGYVPDQTACASW